MMINKIMNPPDWYKNIDYSFTRGLDKAGWFNQIYIRLSHEYEFLKYKDDCDKTWANNHWRAYLKTIENIAINPPLNTTTFNSIKEINKSNLSKEKISGDQRLLEINLRAPDGVIIKNFKDWLNDQRSTFPRPVIHRGRKSLEGSLLTNKDLKSIANSKILELFDLRYWKKVNKKNVSNETLIEWIFHGHNFDDAKDKFKSTNKLLERHIENIEAFLY